jgi:predicted metalloprotease with PDZ domain
MKNCIKLLFIFTNFIVFSQKDKEINVNLNLNVIKDDKIQVVINPPKLSSKETIYHIPKIVPGTYSEDDYGRFIEDFKAFDKKGRLLTVTKIDDNSWKINNAKKIASITYWVNDTYDIEETHEIFSPSGTNIDKDNFVLNLHGFVGYFKEIQENPYILNINKPENLFAATALDDINESTSIDVFKCNRYFDVIDNPILYSTDAPIVFKVEDMDIILSVYSPNKIVNAEKLRPDMEKMMKAQKKFLGNINDNKRYAILLYMSDMSKPNAKGFGALEHHKSTVVVMPESLPYEELSQSMTDVVSHEFFHIVSPLSIHSKEIHYFDFNTPKMSKHLWLYEGNTEYFANLFQVNQGLISDDEFYKRIATKIDNAKIYDNKMPFTKLSKEVLQKPYKDNYLNVYEKGTLIAMCIDIIIREKSDGKEGILTLMKKLSQKYGVDKPFDDEELFEVIEQMTYPEVRKFLDTYVAAENEINYDDFFSRMGVSKTSNFVPGFALIENNLPLIGYNQDKGQFYIPEQIELNEFMTTIGLNKNDILLEINNTKCTLENIQNIFMSSISWKEGDDITIKISRNNQEKIIKGKVVLPKIEKESFILSNKQKESLNNAWLRG